MFLIDWLQRRLGFHVCDEFTQWEELSGRFSRPRDIDDIRAGVLTETIEFTSRWQERQCTICGKIEQRRLGQTGPL